MSEQDPDLAEDVTAAVGRLTAQVRARGPMARVRAAALILEIVEHGDDEPHFHILRDEPVMASPAHYDRLANAFSSAASYAREQRDALEQAEPDEDDWRELDEGRWPA